MKILSDSERTKLITYLTEHGSDQVLIDAVSENLEQLSRSRSEYKKLSTQLGQSGREITADDRGKKVDTDTSEVSHPTTRPEPPGIAAGRIGARTLSEIKSTLGRGRMSLEDINKVIKGKLDNTTALMKLLWTRNVVEWDEPFYKLKG